MIEIERNECVGTNIGVRRKRIERKRRSRPPEIRVKAFFGQKRLWASNPAESKQQDKRADKAAAKSESEPGDLPSHSLRTTLAVWQKPTIGTEQGWLPGGRPEPGPGETLGC